MSGLFRLAWLHERRALLSTVLVVVVCLAFYTPGYQTQMNLVQRHLGQYYDWPYVLAFALGLFWAAPLLAREQQSATIDVAYSQSIPRARWLTVRILPPLLAAAATPAATIALLAAVRGGSPVFDMDSHLNELPALTGQLLFTVALGLLAGAVLRRVVPAMVVTAAGFYFSQYLSRMTDALVRPHSQVIRHPQEELALSRSPQIAYHWIPDGTNSPYRIYYYTHAQVTGMTWLGAALYLTLAAAAVGGTYYWMTRKVPRA